jgi:hypothetical protein
LRRINENFFTGSGRAATSRPKDTYGHFSRRDPKKKKNTKKSEKKAKKKKKAEVDVKNAGCELAVTLSLSLSLYSELSAVFLEKKSIFRKISATLLTFLILTF